MRCALGQAVCSKLARAFVGAALGAAIVASTSAAHCEEKPLPAWSDRRLVVEGVAGFGTPVGLAGVIARFDVVPWISIGGGGGLSPGGVEYTGLVLGRPVLVRGLKALTALTLEAGYSAGGTYDVNPNHSCLINDCRQEWTHPVYHLRNAQWIDVEAGVEVRFLSGVSFRVFGGIAKLANPHSATCKTYDLQTDAWTPAPCAPPIEQANRGSALFPDISGPSGAPDLIFVLGGAVGYAFAL
jgi:hypothetical protein